ncbi:uncharacterized protein DNG_10506 [Cephalotrichum gorgonifer]|nr:uncharacterized protein DNG_10506 [Cephalotrichum gorgonifer]
MAITIK